MHYEAIFHGQTSATQSLADKAIWVASLSLDEMEIEEPDKVAKFTAACIRLASAANEIDLVITDNLNRHNYEALQKDSNTAQVLAAEIGSQWRLKKQKDLDIVKNLKNTFSWEAIFEGVDKQALLALVKQHYAKVTEFQLAVDSAASHRVSFITEMALKKKPSVSLAPAQERLRIFTDYVLEECAGVLAMRLKGYEHAFYLAKLNLATSSIATTIFPLEAETSNSEILSAINKTILRFHTPSQYKPINATPQQVSTTQIQRTKEQSLSSLNTVEDRKSNDIERMWLTAVGMFMDNKSIPAEAKVDYLLKLTPSNRNNNAPEVSTATLQRTDTIAPLISGGLGFSMTTAASTQQNQNNSNNNNSNSSSNNSTNTNSSTSASSTSTLNIN